MKKGFLALTLIGLLALIPTAAFADTCAGGQTVLSDNTGNVEACLTLSGGNTVTITDFFWNGVETTVKVFAIDWNTSALLSGDTDAVDGPWKQDFGNNTGFADGWKSFFGSDLSQAGVSKFNGFNLGGGNPVQTSFSWTFGASPGTDFALHIGGFDNCSVWVSTFYTSERADKTNTCGGGGEVPEPASLTLLGTGLVGLGGMLRKKLRKKA